MSEEFLRRVPLMISTDNLCMSCMKEIGNEKTCPYCGYHVDSSQISPYLPVRTVIANRYLVGKLLSYNGEGATYIGWDLSEKKAVNIREFIPDSISMRTTRDLTLRIMSGSEMIFRDCNQSFLELWRKLARFRGLSALISVTDVVEDYGTSYAIYDYIEGITFREFLLRSETGYISWEKARPLLMPILSTLGTLHSSGIIHRGISPTTLIIGTDGKVRITGFCIGQVRSVRGELNAQIFPGYAAIEQYGLEGQQGPWTDIYAFGAVLYRTLIGSDPIEATERATNDRLMVPGRFAEQIPAYVINGLINSLQILPDDRTRTVEHLRAELSASPIAAAASEQYPPRKQTPQPAKPATAAPVAPSGAPAQPARRPAPAGKPSPAKKQIPVGPTIAVSAVASLLVCLGIFFALAFTVFKDNFYFNTRSREPVTEATTVDASDMLPVPDFKGKSYLDIESNPVFTDKYEFKAIYEYNDAVESGYVIRQDIVPDTSVPRGTVITLVVSQGAETIPLPDVRGMRYSEAAEKLVSMGFRVKKQVVTTSSGYLPGQVCGISGVPEKAYRSGEIFTLKVVAEDETTTEIPQAVTDPPTTAAPATTVPPSEGITGFNTPPVNPDAGPTP